MQSVFEIGVTSKESGLEQELSVNTKELWEL